MDGGCSIPVFGLAQLNGEEIQMKGGIISLDGKQRIFENHETSTYLLGAALGGGYAVYKGKKVLLGVAFGLITAYFYLEYLDKPSKNQ